MKKTLLIAMLMLLACTGVIRAQENLKMQFNFENVQGDEVTDPISGVTAKLVNKAAIIEMGNRHVLDLGNGSGYLNMTKSAGEVVRNMTDYTVSVYYRVASKASLSGAGYFLWCFSQSSANTQTSAPYMAVSSERTAWRTVCGWKESGRSYKYACPEECFHRCACL